MSHHLRAGTGQALAACAPADIARRAYLRLPWHGKYEDAVPACPSADDKCGTRLPPRMRTGHHVSYASRCTA
jgi:hypothetical protein